MIFITIEFAIFLAVVLAAYQVLPRAGRNALLLGSSYFFYGWAKPEYLALLITSTLVDFFAAQKMPDAGPRRRKLLLLASVCVNLGMLGFFKYYGFFVTEVARLIESVGLQANMPVLQVILPVGISFYTFQTMSYTIDVYRGKQKPTKNLLNFALYVAYFPQLVAGPIERASHILPQLESERRVTAEQIGSGALLILIGLVRKMALADFVAPYVNEVFADPGSMGRQALVLGIFLFSVQIYGDFAGYTDIARGVSRILGIELMENFRRPYFARNITEFWHRWHISLSTWLRDYLYIPLGGNRGSELFRYRNLMLTMILGGLWHGAAWTFVMWGTLHGVALVVHKLWLKARGAAKNAVPATLPGAVAGWLVTMAFVGVAWVFFRAESFSDALDVLFGIIRPSGGERLPWGVAVYALTMLLFIDVPQALRNRQEALLDWPWWLRDTVYAGFIVAIIVTHRAEPVPFIYFQF